MPSVSATAATSNEPLLFEYVGEVVSGLSYVHSVLPVDIAGLDRQLRDYAMTVEREFDSRTLEKTHKEFVSKLTDKARTNKTSSLNFDRSILAKWKEIGAEHLEEVKVLRERVRILYQTVPPTQEDDGPNEQFMVYTRDDSNWDLDFVKKPEPDILEKVEPRAKRPRTRVKRVPVAAAAAAGILGVGGTAFGIYNTVQISKIWESIDVIENKLIAFEQVFEETTKDIVELQDEIHGILLKQLLDSAFDTGYLVARLRTQYHLFADRIVRYSNVMQMAQLRRLAVDYLDEVTLKRIFDQANFRARQVNCVMLIRQPSDLFQLEMSYSYNGRKVLLMLHIPISPAESTMRLYRLHPFPLPVANDTFLIPDVTEQLLGISNTNHRYTVQYELADLVGCHRMGKIFLCERNGLLHKYPENTCLGSLYQQKYEDARDLCAFHLEPAREYVRQLKDNWYLIYSEMAITVPLKCSNSSYSELHIRAGASKFHLTAGCIADLPRHRIVSDLSVLIPQDYIQFDMEWDPVSFMPTMRDHIVPEFQRLQRYGVSRAALSQVQANIASSKDQPAWYHNIHFSGNTLALLTALVGVTFGVYGCVRNCRRDARERRGRIIEEAVRTALNNGTPRTQLAMPVPMPIPSRAPSTVYTMHPAQHHMPDPMQTLTRPNSYTNLTSISEVGSRHHNHTGVPLSPYPPMMGHPTSTPTCPPGPAGPEPGYGLPAYRKSMED